MDKPDGIHQYLGGSLSVDLIGYSAMLTSRKCHQRVEPVKMTGIHLECPSRIIRAPWRPFYGMVKAHQFACKSIPCTTRGGHPRYHTGIVAPPPLVKLAPKPSVQTIVPAVHIPLDVLVSRMVKHHHSAALVSSILAHQAHQDGSELAFQLKETFGKSGSRVHHATLVRGANLEVVAEGTAKGQRENR